MSPRYFAKRNSNFRQQEDIGLTNTFVAFTHAIGLKGFTYVPPTNSYQVTVDPEHSKQGHVQDPSERYK